MDQMDIDPTFDVPDTPSRLSTQRMTARRSNPEENHHLSMPCNSGQQRFLEDAEDQPKVVDRGSRGPTLRPQKSGHLFRRGMPDKLNFMSQNSSHARQLQSIRPPHNFTSLSSSQGDGFVDLTERSPHRSTTGNTSSSRILKDNQLEFPKRLGSTSGTSSLKGMAKFSNSSRNFIKETGNVNGVDSSIGHREGADFVGNVQNETVNSNFPSLDPIAPPKVIRQRRLVRNGCISPNNIAKAKQLAEKNTNGSEDVGHNNCGSVASSSPFNSTDIRELVAEDNDSITRKGKGILTYPCSSEGHDLRNKNLHGRSCFRSNEKAMENGDSVTHAGKSIEGGWRSTHNRTRGIYLSSSSSDRAQHSLEEADGSRCSSQQQDNMVTIKDKGTSSSVVNDYPIVQNLVSPEHVHSQPLTESVSHPRVRLGQLNKPHSAADALIKRQRQRAISTNCAESSTLVSNDPEIVCLSSSAEAANPSYTSSKDDLHRVIEIDELSPPSTHNIHNEDTRARQVEADERLARELQEQLYNESPVFGVGEIDEHIAMAMQHQDDLNHGVFQRGSSRANLPRSSQSRSSSNIPRRGSLSHGSTSGRMTRLRSRFAGQPRTVLPSRRTSVFPADMDVDTRMHILGALEDISNMAAASGFLQSDHDFTENDYEMLLALDDNNDQHRGASSHRINSLPQSTVQNDNFGEACAICLETPSTGDTIRHLPCLHKFHKDCIDQWLRRRTSCPVCKSSIT